MRPEQAYINAALLPELFKLSNLDIFEEVCFNDFPLKSQMTLC
jgi:hypothetical protein